jgi:hypothetical protein
VIFSRKSPVSDGPICRYQAESAVIITLFPRKPMAISSSSIIHFTRTKAALKGILKDNFKVKFCLETVCLVDNPVSHAFPMVSFCDIPLSQVKEHIDKYGSYGIGLTKEWAKREGLSPVQYVATGSLYARSLRKLVNSNVPNPPMKWDAINDTHRSVLDVMRYVKNYEADLTRNGTTRKNYRFYDEREWRYVPGFSEDFPMIATGESYEKASLKTALNRAVSSLRLKFNPHDIKYIIVKTDSEISEFVTAIRESKGKHYSLEDIERLTTRIITREQIETDL